MDNNGKPRVAEASLSTLDRCLLVAAVVLLLVVVIEGGVLLAAQNALRDRCEATMCSSQIVDATLSLMTDDAHVFRKRHD